MITWGIIAALMTFVQTEMQFYAVRILLGIAEAGFVPGVVYLLTLWFPSQVRARMTALFIAAIPAAVVVGAPLSALLIKHGEGFYGLEGWRVMFLVEAVPAVVVGVFAFFALPDSLDRVPWLSGEEREGLSHALAAEQQALGEHGTSAVLAALRDWRIYAAAVIGFSVNMGGYALSFFLPTVIASFSQQFDRRFTLGQTALLTAIPYACAAVALILVGRSSDRRQERHFHAAVPLVVGAIAVALYLPSTTAVMVAISVAAAGSYVVLPVFWQLPPRFLSGAALAAGMGVAGGLANVAGFVAPYMTGALHDSTGSYRPAMLIVAAVMLVGAATALLLRRRPEFCSTPTPLRGLATETTMIEGGSRA